MFIQGYFVGFLYRDSHFPISVLSCNLIGQEVPLHKQKPSSCNEDTNTLDVNMSHSFLSSLVLTCNLNEYETIQLRKICSNPFGNNQFNCQKHMYTSMQQKLKWSGSFIVMSNMLLETTFGSTLDYATKLLLIVPRGPQVALQGCTIP